jgi:hypothetical protein
MLMALRLLLCVAGTILLGLVLLVYENDEKTIQSRLEDYWIKLDDRRLKSVATERVLVARLSSFASRILDNFLGHRLISRRAIIVSVLVSLSTIFLFSNLVALIRLHTGVITTTFWIADIGLLGLVLALGLLVRRQVLYASILLAGFFGFCCYRFFIGDSFRNYGYAFLVGSGLGVILSVLTDILLLLLIRLFLRRSSMLLSGFNGFLICAFSLMLAIAVWLGPPMLIKFHNPTFEAKGPLQTVELAADAVFLTFNASDFLFLLGLFMAVALLLLHHSLWPVLLRVLYPLQRANLFSHKKEMASAALAMIYAGLPFGKTWMTPTFDLIKKLFGG